MQLCASLLSFLLKDSERARTIKVAVAATSCVCLKSHFATVEYFSLNHTALARGIMRSIVSRLSVCFHFIFLTN